MGKFLDAAEIILKRAERPMHVRELTDRAIESRLLETSGGKTPWQTMKAKLSVDIKRKGGDSRFKRLAPGRFTLRELTGAEYLSPGISRKLAADSAVLVFPVKRLRQIGWFHGVSQHYSRYIKLMDIRNAVFMSRIEAETNPAYKQVISYVLIRRNASLLRFVRGSYSSAESFLRGRYCIGFGGHVERHDFRLALFDQFDSGYRNSILRELSEELRLPTESLGDERLQYLGAINDDSSFVGKLHFAFVHLLDLDDARLPQSASKLKREKSINKLKWVPITELGNEFEHYEYWSKLCIQQFYSAAVRIKCKIRPVHNFKLSKHSSIIAVVGTIGSGKTEVSRMLESNFGYECIATGKLVEEIVGISVKDAGRITVQNLAQKFIESRSGPAELAGAVAQRIQSSTKKKFVIDGLRNLRTLEALRAHLGRRIALIYVESTVDNAYEFYKSREDKDLTFDEFIAILQHKVECEIPDFMRSANVIIYNHGTKHSYNQVVANFFKHELG
jgi:predicted NUDIX family phosphoesterase/dephospho-CoA kinase